MDGLIELTGPLARTVAGQELNDAMHRHDGPLP